MTNYKVYKVGDLVRRRGIPEGVYRHDLGVVIKHDKEYDMIRVRWTDPDRGLSSEHPNMIEVVYRPEGEARIIY